MANVTASQTLPPLPAYTLTPRPQIMSRVSDPLLQMLLPVITYWVVSGFFHLLDCQELFSKYRLHTPAEILKRNRVTRYEVIRDVIVQQILQTMFGLLIAHFDPIEMTGRDDYDVAVWAQRLRVGQRSIPRLLGLFGLNAIVMSKRAYKNYPQLASVLAGGLHAPNEFTSWEIAIAKAIHWVFIPAVRFGSALFIVDTWQYFLHRAMHMNKFLYAKIHSRHHRLYVPYAFGALYNHPLEGFLLETIGTAVAYLATGMNVRQGMWLFTCLTAKTVDDHCGYRFPWDPLQMITENNAAYHDIHHQSWGIKSNFAQPCSTFWDRLLGTEWTGKHVSSPPKQTKS